MFQKLQLEYNENRLTIPRKYKNSPAPFFQVAQQVKDVQSDFIIGKIGRIYTHSDFHTPVTHLLFPRLHIPVGILRIPVFSVPVALFPQESRFLFRRNLFFTPSEIRSVWGLRRMLRRK